ncbi:MAG: hypothetical protein IPK53_08480 [bacterium]|nr:hypothetical protein [bacterium]
MAYARAQELCANIDDSAQLVPALWLLATFRLGRSEHVEVDKLCARLLRLAQQAGDPDLLALARFQVSPFYQGKFIQARLRLEEVCDAPLLVGGNKGRHGSRTRFCLQMAPGS